MSQTWEQWAEQEAMQTGINPLLGGTTALGHVAEQAHGGQAGLMGNIQQLSSEWQAFEEQQAYQSQPDYGAAYDWSQPIPEVGYVPSQPTYAQPNPYAEIVAPAFTRTYGTSGQVGSGLSPEWERQQEFETQYGSPDLTALYDDYFAQQGYGSDPGSRVMAGSPAALEQQVREQYGRDLAAAYDAGLISDAEYRAQAANLAGRSSGDGYGLRAIAFPFQQYENLQNMLGGGTILPDWMGGPTWNEGINAATDFAAEGLRPSDTLRNIPVLGTVLDAPATVADFIRPRGLLDVAVEAGPGGFIFDAARGTGRAAPPPARIGEALPSLPDARLLRNPLLEVPQYSDEMAQVYNRTAGIAGVPANMPTRNVSQLPFGTQMAGGADETLSNAPLTGGVGEAGGFPSPSSASPPRPSGRSAGLPDAAAAQAGSTPAPPSAVIPPSGTVPPAGGPPVGTGGASGADVPGNRFIGDLRPFDEVQAEVVTSENPIVRAIMGRTGINPSVVENSDVGKALTAYMRQRVATDELTSTAVAAALDPYAARFTGGMSRVLPISDDGLMAVTRNGVRGSAPWQDVFSAPHRFSLTDETLDYVADYRRVLDEVEALRVSHGLEPRAMNREGYFYTPRQVKGIRGVEITRPSKANLSRVYEDAVDGFANGVRYDADPRATLDLHVRNAYREIAEKQLSDALEPISVKPSDLIPAPIKTRLEAAIKNKRAAEQAFRREAFETQRALTETLGTDVARAQRELTNAEASLARVQGEIAARQTRKQAPVSLGRRLQEATQRVERARQNLADFQRAGRNVPRGKAGAARMVTDDALIQRVEQARDEFNAAKNAYIKAGERARNASVADASFFGGNQGDTIPIAQWRNRFFKKEDAEQLADAIGRFTRKGNVTAPAWAAEQAGKAINYVRFLSSVGDFGAPFIQGMPVLARNPAAWAKATANHYKAFVDPRVQSRFIREHIDTFQEMARHGVPIGDPEFFRATEAGGGFTLPMPDSVRKVTRQTAKQTTGRFSAAYGTFLGDSRALLWESSKLPPAQRAQYIRNMTGGLDPRALRVSPEQRAVEGMWLAFSPRLMRSTMALVKDAMNPTTPVGRESLRTLATLATGATGMYIAAGLALGKDWDEIENGLNPLNGKKFLSHEVNGDWIGIGGQIRAIAQLIGKSAADPQGLLSDSFYDNPLISYFGGRGAPAVNIGGAVVEAVTGLNTSPFERIDGLPDLLKHIGTSALPFALQGILEGENVMTSLAAFFGMRTSPETTNERLTRQSGDAIEQAIAAGAFPADTAEALKGLSFSDLTSRERLALENFARESGNDDLLSTLKQREKELRENRSIFQLKRDEVDAYWKRYSNQMDGMYEALFNGTMSATDVRERLRKLQQDARTLYDLDMEYQEAVSKLPERDINKAMDEYYSLYDRIHEKYGQVDRNLLDAAQEAYLKRVESENPTLAARVRFNLQEQDDPADHKLVKIFDAAQPLFDEYYSVDEKERVAFRVANPRTDYLLWLLGYVTTVRTQEAADLARQTTSREVKVIE